MPRPCPAGEYCAQAGLSTPTGKCNAGFFCNGSDIIANATPCRYGHYCPEGTATEVACPPGTFSGKR